MAFDWAQMISGVVGAGINYFSQQSANETNIQLAREQRDFYYDQWLRENAHNDPSAQMARLQRAGLNPALMYGEGAGSMPASASMSGVDSARVQAPQVDPYLMAQIANLNAQTEATKDANERENEKQGYALQTMRQSIENMKTQNEQLKADIRKMDAEVEDIYIQWTFKNLELSISQELADKQCELWNSTIAKQNEEMKLTAEQTRQLIALYDLQKQGIELSNQEIRSRIAVNRAEATRLKKCLDLMDKEMTNLQASADLSDMQRKFVKTTAEASASLSKAQAAYYKDYKEHPEKYRAKIHSESSSHEFGTSQARGGSSHSVYDSQ